MNYTILESYMKDCKEWGITPNWIGLARHYKKITGSMDKINTTQVFTLKRYQDQIKANVSLKTVA